MTPRSLLQALLAIFVVFISFNVVAQVSVTPAEELHKRINVNHKVNTLTTDLFGDQVDLYTGSLSFTQTDVSLKGNSGLRVEISRSFAVGGTYKLWDSRGDFGDWLLNLPRVEVIIANNDLEDGFGKCDKAPYVPSLAFATGTYSAPPWHSWEYSQGFHLIIPGAGSQELLSRNQNKYSVAPGGNTNNQSGYKLVTKNHWQVRCITPAGAPSATGAGYLAVSPEGTRYYLTEFTTRTAAHMASATEFKSWLGRSVVQALPSKVVDRFGNTVHYSYNSQGNLERIYADDGREITLTYYGSGHIAYNQIKSVTAWPGTPEARTWHYDYEGSQYVSYLSQITLPGHTSSQPRQWHFNMHDLAFENPIYLDGVYSCGEPNNVGGGASGSMTHPMGVTGEFWTGTIRQGRANVTYDCQRNTPESPWFLWTPRHVFTTSITHKRLTGPGLKQLDWSYQYSETEGWFNNPPFPDDTPNKTKKWVEVTDPTGASVRHYFSMMWDATEGQLLKTVYKDANGTVLRTEERDYALTDWRMNSSVRRSNDLKAGTTSRLIRLETHQNGDIYTKTLSDYTVFDQAQTISRFTSGIPNQETRTETYTYLNDTSVSAPSPSTTVWVISLPDTTNVNGIETVDYGYSGGTRQLTSIQEFGVTTAQFGYNSNGTLAWFDDALDNRTTYNNYTLGIPKLITYPDGTDLNLTVNADGNIASKTDARGYTTRYGYDASGRLDLIDYPNNDTVNWADTTINFAPTAQSEYGIPAGHWRQIVTRGDNQIVTYYDGLLRPLITRNRDIGGDVIFISRAFDHAGRTLFTSYPTYSAPNYDPGTIANTAGIEKTYDALGRLTAIKDTTDGSDTTIGYWSNNRKIVTGPRGYQTRHQYQVFDQPAYNTLFRTIAAYGQPEQATTTINRDILGRMQTVTQSGSYNGQSVSETRRYVYDNRGQLCKRVNPETGQSVFRFDNAGNLRWSATNVGGTPTACEAGVSNDTYGTIPASKVVVNKYDNRNRIIATDYPSGTADTCYQYGATGNLTRIATLTEYSGGCPSSGTLTRWAYDYNGLNLLTSETLHVDSQTFDLSYIYDINGNRAQITYPTGRNYLFFPDGLGRTTQISGLVSGTIDRTGVASAIKYHPNGALRQFRYVNEAIYNASQTDDTLPDVIAVQEKNGFKRINFDYDYDQANNVTRILDGFMSANTVTMSYDALNRLKTATADLWVGIASYEYDPLGNLRQKTINGGTANYSYASNNQLDSITGSISRNYQYDDHGNVIADGNFQYNYDLANRLTTVTGTASYLYDGHGRRVKHVNLSNGEISYSVYSKAGKRMHQYNADTDTPEDFIYLGGFTIARLTGDPVTPAVSSITITGGPADGTYSVNWGNVAYATTYFLQESKNGAGWTDVYSGTGVSYSASRSAGGYHYRVKACSFDGCGDWTRTSNPAGVVPERPDNIYTPSGTQTSAGYSVSWSYTWGATDYILLEQVNGGSWHNVSLSASNINQRRKSFSKSNGTYRYAIKACNQYGCGSYRYSVTFTIELPPPVPGGLTAPADVHLGIYTVSWNSASGALRYELQERSTSDYSWGTVYGGGNQETLLQRSGPMRYLYRVRACKTVACSPWSGIISVYVRTDKIGGGKW